MKKGLLFLMLWMSHGLAFSQQGWVDRSRILPDRLQHIPTGIILLHAPTPVWPEINTDTLNYPGKYLWKHLTSVKTSVETLEVIAAGSYIWWKDKGWLPNMNLTKADFAKLFNCKQGILRKGRTYTFFKNYRYGDGLYAGDALWFILAKDKMGKIYKGIAIVETEGILKNSTLPSK